ncbi:hypothetical protein LP414_08475 [Polaromonas sp. P1(28)-13]|nr:hypothetical protein LP414_08475 [Polaromonas sp. P1(28)-13]
MRAQDALKAKSRHKDMRVIGISQADGEAMADAGNPFPYPLGPECARTCEAFAAVVPAYRNKFRQTLPLPNPQSV